MRSCLPAISGFIIRLSAGQWSRNGWELWHKAIKEFIRSPEEPEFWDRIVHGGPQSSQNLTAAEYQLAQQILNSNQACLRLLEEGAQRNQIQFREFESLKRIQDESDTINQLNDVARLLLIRSKLLATVGDYLNKAAAHALIEMLRMGEMICNGDGQILHYLIGALDSRRRCGAGHRSSSGHAGNADGCD